MQPPQVHQQRLAVMSSQRRSPVEDVKRRLTIVSHCLGVSWAPAGYCWAYVGDVHTRGLNVLDPLLNLRRISWRGFVQRRITGRRDGCHLGEQVVLAHFKRIITNTYELTVRQRWGTWDESLLSTCGGAGSHRVSGLGRGVSDD